MLIMNYAQLEEFIKTLTPEQKQQHVVIQVLDETSVRLKEISVNDVDYFYNEDSEGLIPVSEYDPEHWDGKLLTDEDYNTIVPAGSRVFAYDETFGDDDKVTHVIRPYQIIAAMNKIGWETKEHGWDKIVFEKDGKEITVLENAKLSTLLDDLTKIEATTGVGLIAQERAEQKTKHKRTLRDDKIFNSEGQLSFVAGLISNKEAPNVPMIAQYCPPGWDVEYFMKLINKPYPDRLKIAGALIAAELDRVNNSQ